MMTRHLVVGLLSVVVLVSCARSRSSITSSAPPGPHLYAIAQREGGEAMDACAERRERGELPNRVASVQCSNPLVRAAWLRVGYPYMDLVDLFLAYRLAVAERLDAGALTVGEADLMFAELRVRLDTEARQRDAVYQSLDAQRQAAQAQSDAARAAILQGLGGWRPLDFGPRPPAYRQPITCYSYGNMTRCQ